MSLEVHKFESSHWSDADGGGPWTDVSRDCMDDEPDFGEEFANKNQLEIESELLLLWSSNLSQKYICRQGYIF